MDSNNCPNLFSDNAKIQVRVGIIAALRPEFFLK